MGRLPEHHREAPQGAAQREAPRRAAVPLHLAHPSQARFKVSATHKAHRAPHPDFPMRRPARGIRPRIWQECLARYERSSAFRQDRPPFDQGLAYRVNRTQRFPRRPPPGHVPAGRVGARSSVCATLSGDPLLVRSGSGMVPTDAGAAHDRAQRKHLARRRDAVLRRPRLRSANRDQHLPRRRQRLPRSAVPARNWCRRSRRRRRMCHIEMHPAVGRFGLPRAAGPRRGRRGGRQLAASRPEDLHLGKLFADEVVCLVVQGPSRPRGAAGRSESWLAGRAHRADAHAPRRPRRDRRAPGKPGPGAQHHRALPALRLDPAAWWHRACWC